MQKIFLCVPNPRNFLKSTPNSVSLQMASLSMCHVINNHSPIQELKTTPKTTNTRGLVLLTLRSCQRPEAKAEKEMKQGKGVVQHQRNQVFEVVGRFGKELKESLSPKHKGDMKDVVLMSLSFGVYVYISQKIVCAYCVWMSMLKQQPW